MNNRWEDIKHYHICNNGCAGNPEVGEALLNQDLTKIIGRIKAITWGWYDSEGRLTPGWQINHEIEWYQLGSEPTPTLSEIERAKYRLTANVSQ